MHKSRGRGGRRPNPAFQQRGSSGGSGVSEVLLKQARQSGQLNLSNRSLESVPSTVWRINVDPPPEHSVSFGAAGDDKWWDQVDLVKLILAGNMIQELSEDIHHLPALIVLDAHDNRLTCLPVAIGGLENLSKLLLSHNSLPSLQPAVCSLTSLQYLKLDHNSLRELPDDLGQLTRLDELDISNNQLTTLPQSIGDLTSLKTLSASHNQLSTLPEAIGSLGELRTLTLNNNKMTEIPTLFKSSHLEVVELQYNHLTAVPQIVQGTNIKQLRLGFNKLSAINTDRLSPLTSLVYLDLRDNKIDIVPDGVTGLKTLERFDVTNNSITGLPYEMGNMPNLKSLMLEGNNLRGIRRDIIQRGTTAVLKYLRSRIQTDTPQEEPQHHSTKFTPTKRSNTRKITPPSSTSGCGPGDLGLSPEKRNVDLSKKTLTAFPMEVFEHKQITDLSLGYNKLTAVPPEIGQLTAITVLDLRNNTLTTLPSELEGCTRIADIVLSFNRFRELPSVLYKLKHLENIIASDNLIESINVEGLREIPGLACLDLQNNSIGQVPPQLGTLTTLKHLQLGGNPFRIPRASVLASGTAAVLDYLRDRIPT